MKKAFINQQAKSLDGKIFQPPEMLCSFSKTNLVDMSAKTCKRKTF